MGNSSRPAVNMHLGMSLLETDGDGGFMVSGRKGGGRVSEGSWQRKQPYGKGNWSVWRGHGVKNPGKQGGESRGGASTPPSTGSTFCGRPSEPVSNLRPHPQACAPLWSRACGSSVFSSGICARVDASFRPQGSLAPTAQREPEEGPEDSVLRTGCRVGKNGGQRMMPGRGPARLASSLPNAPARASWFLTD